MLDRTVKEIREGSVYQLLPDETQAQIRGLSEEEVREGARRVMTRPQPGDVSQAGRLLLNPCLAVQWLETFEMLDLPRDLNAYEPCAGASEPALFATEIYTDGRGRYTTLNLNRPLAAQFREKIGKVRVPVRIIEEDATGDDLGLEPQSFDVACFHHAINDLLQTAVSEPRGMDTRTVDWWPNERQMIEWLAEEDEAGQLDERARPALLSAVRNAVDLVKPGGALLFDHWTWVAHSRMDWFPWELFCNLIPLARGWIEASDLPLTEIPLAGRDPQWWMVFRKDSER
jgi:SAM-dependent methyltransferase